MGRKKNFENKLDIQYKFIEDEDPKKSNPISNNPNEPKRRGRPPLRDERRSERIIFLLTPTLSQKLKRAAKETNSSLNDYIFNLVEKEMNKNQEEEFGNYGHKK